MASTYLTFTLNLSGVPVTVARHCTHDDGQTTWRVEFLAFETVVYLHGTPAQLRGFGASIAEAADDGRPSGAELSEDAALSSDSISVNS